MRLAGSQDRSWEAPKDCSRDVGKVKDNNCVRQGHSSESMAGKVGMDLLFLGSVYASVLYSIFSSGVAEMHFRPKEKKQLGTWHGFAEVSQASR